ncbi:polymorphic toxin-type HINT domain-containing protein [Brasilonema sp. UFV-L1]|uniref:polymorphic toxin-type HINT domain-containing protein n=1 Tax=Brasilonema sp. UFV-L1 TaxID=2234130 RepID=UPI00145EBD81|nr:polymorphic toxin-type HINT domain-containing protein [Brasilonema sp. UFV-L1]NMG11138.1 hypothetical protein [Brasilonema sp. UFV-L1]
MAIDKAIQLAERYDQELIKMEDAAIERMNKALDTAFKQLDRELTKSYDNIASNATILQAQRKALILQQLGSLLQIVRPQDAKMYQSVLQILIDNSIDAGADLGGSLIKTINPAIDVKPFADVPIEAVASASKNAYERLQRHGAKFADVATEIIDQGLIQGFGIQKIRQPLQQQLGVTKSRAEMIARTETIAAYNDAADQRYADAEIEGVLWIAIGDKRTCFPAGTLVKTINGERPIESIKEGDKVLTRFGYRRVVKTLSRPYYGEFTRLQLSDRSVVSTSNHPIWTTKGWTQAGKIKPGCIVKLDNKSLAQVLSVENLFVIKPDNASIVYNLTVEQYPEYYANGILVHNCPYCLSRHMKVYKRGSMRPPLHPSCVTGDSMILSDPIKGATRRHYNGDIFIIETARGNKLTITPNHPVLTPQGWVTPQSLKIGDDLISCIDSERMSNLLVNSDNNQRPTVIKEIFTAFSQSSLMSTREVEVTTKDFHDDLGNYNSKVKIVNTDFDSSPFASIDFFSSTNTTFFNDSTQSRGASESQLSSILNRFPGIVESDRIINITKSTHNDYVYNLETTTEYYICNNIMVHNCRCTLAPVNMAWIEAGIVDVNALRSERQRALEEAIVDPKEEPAPFERAAGIKSLPKPIYIPVITVPPKPVITSGSAEMVTATPKAKTKRTPKPKQPSINYSVNRYNPQELIQLGAKFTEQNLKIPEISDRERQLEKALANARQKLQEEIQAGSPSPKTIDAFRKAENAYYKEQEKRQEAETKEYDKLRQAIKKKHGELDVQALVDKINFQNLGEITTQTLKSTYQDFFELTGGKGARSIKTLKYDDPRAYASRYDNTINIGKGAEKGTQFHEAGHHVEFESKDLQMAMNIWRNQRAYSLQYKSLKELTGIDYDDDEVALEDKYLDPYVGKVYANDSTEVLSMGIEHFTDAKTMRRLRETDKQHFDLIMGVILANEN